MTPFTSTNTAESTHAGADTSTPDAAANQTTASLSAAHQPATVTTADIPHSAAGTLASEGAGGMGARSCDLIAQTTKARCDAVAMLRSLLDARVRTQAALSISPRISRSGRVAPMDTAIASTERLIAAYDRVLSRLRGSLSQADLDLLEEIRAA